MHQNNSPDTEGRTSADSGQESLTTRKEYTDPGKIRQDERRSGKRRLSRIAPAHGRVGDLKQGRLPYQGNCVGHWRSIWGFWSAQNVHTHTSIIQLQKKKNTAICENLTDLAGILLSEIRQRQIPYELLKQT